jgi:hypothetical protein
MSSDRRAKLDELYKLLGKDAASNPGNQTPSILTNSNEIIPTIPKSESGISRVVGPAALIQKNVSKTIVRI